MNLELLLKGLLLAWWIANFIPLQDFLEKWVKPFIYFDYIKNAISCGKCLVFWSILIWGAFKYDDLLIWEAIAGSAIYYIYERLLNSLKTYL